MRPGAASYGGVIRREMVVLLFAWAFPVTLQRRIIAIIVSFTGIA